MFQDLKKQTALRLAQEQQQGQAIPGPPTTAAVASDPRTKHPVVTPQTLAARRLASSMPHVNAQSVNRETTPVHYQRLHHPHNPMVHHIPNTADSSPGIVPAYGASSYYDQSPHVGKNPRGRNGRPAKAPPQQSVSFGFFDGICFNSATNSQQKGVDATDFRTCRRKRRQVPPQSTISIP